MRTAYVNGIMGITAETLGNPYYKKIPLPRIPYIHEPGLASLSGVSAAAASVITVEYPQWSPTREQTVELSPIMMSSLSMQRLAQMINSTHMWICMHNDVVTSIIILHQA